MKPPKNQSPQTKPNEDAVQRNLQPLDSVGKKDKTADTLRGDDEILKEALNCSTHTITKIKRAIALTRKDCEEEINLWKNRFKQAERLYQNLGEKSKQAERQRILEKEIVLLNDIIDWINTSNQQGKKKYFLRLINFIKDTIEELKREIIQNEP